jgi:hypothetical protein
MRKHSQIEQGVRGNVTRQEFIHPNIERVRIRACEGQRARY